MLMDVKFYINYFLHFGDGPLIAVVFFYARKKNETHFSSRKKDNNLNNSNERKVSTINKSKKWSFAYT